MCNWKYNGRNTNTSTNIGRYVAICTSENKKANVGIYVSINENTNWKLHIKTYKYIYRYTKISLNCRTNINETNLAFITTNNKNLYLW